MMMISDIQRKVVENVNLIMKFPQKKGRYEEQLLHYYRSQKDDYEASLVFAFYKYCEITQFSFVKVNANDVIKDILEIYTKLMRGSCEDWFIYSLKLLLYDQLPNHQVDRQGYDDALHEMFQLQQKEEHLHSICIFTYLMQGKLFYNDGDVEKAIGCLKTGIKLCPQNKEIDLELWNHYYQPFCRFLYYGVLRKDSAIIECLNQVEEKYFYYSKKGIQLSSAFSGMKGNDLHSF